MGKEKVKSFRDNKGSLWVVCSGCFIETLIEGIEEA